MAPFTTESAADRARRVLFTGLIDDASAYPPRALPLRDSVAAHRELTSGRWATLIGPLYVPALQTADLKDLLRPDEELDISVVVRPDADLELVHNAIASTLDTPGVHVERIEAWWNPTWSTMELRGLTLVLQVPRTPHAALADIAAGRVALQREVVARFHTGVTRIWHWPNEAELAHFIAEAVAAGVPFILTGGLKPAVRSTRADAADGQSEQHGLLNVLLAVDTAVRGGAPGAVEAVLADRDGEDLAARVAGMGEQRAWATRAFLRSIGSTDPASLIDNLLAYGLASEPLDPVE